MPAIGVRSMRKVGFIGRLALTAGLTVLFEFPARTQELPLEHCDTLPVARVVVGGREFRFLVDTAATSMLNARSFASHEKGEKRRDMRVASWSGMASTSAREVTLERVVIGSAQFSKMKLPAIDLSALGNNCGGAIDGILGVDLLAELGATIDLQRETLHTAGAADKRSQGVPGELNREMRDCLDAFNRSDTEMLATCLETNVAAFTSDADVHGRDPVISYLKEHYFQQGQLRMRETAWHAIGDTVWFEYEITPGPTEAQWHELGLALCRKSDGRWRIASLHSSRVEAVEGGSGEKAR